MRLSIGGSTVSLGVKKDKEEVIDGQDGFVNFREDLDFGWVCGRQDLGSDSGTHTLKTRTRQVCFGG